MLSKSLILFVFASFFNQTYGLEQISCPRWVPGTNAVLPQGVTLSPELELENKVRCYCEVVKRQEAECIRQRVPENICKARTKDWVQKNLKLKRDNMLVTNPISPVPVRDRMINIEP
jgi:hypothetical protein